MSDCRWGKLLFAGACLLSLVAMGCGGKSPITLACKITAINVFPATAAISHTAPPPGNAQHFDAFASAVTPGCVVSQSNLTTGTWAVSDNTNVSISNVQGATFGTATCNGATSGPVTVTATVPAGDGSSVSNTASLTCN
ncbi:MAG: hypothetical protein LAO76_27675 [Acidobacteriia bacterium]|nr:hypothetical protein [Terriglobia bacterium]